jgi:hypothetical protein
VKMWRLSWKILRERYSHCFSATALFHLKISVQLWFHAKSQTKCSTENRAGGISGVVECLPSKHEAQSLNPSISQTNKQKTIEIWTKLLTNMRNKYEYCRVLITPTGFRVQLSVSGFYLLLHISFVTLNKVLYLFEFSHFKVDINETI